MSCCSNPGEVRGFHNCVATVSQTIVVLGWHPVGTICSGMTPVVLKDVNSNTCVACVTCVTCVAETAGFFEFTQFSTSH